MNEEWFAGYKRVELTDEQLDITFSIFVMYPTSIPEKVDNIGPYQLHISSNAKPQAGVFKLVLISHGTGGSPLVYRTIASYLARKGFVVGMIEHPFNNINDNTLEGTVDNLTIRPKHISMAIDWFFNNENFSKILKPDSVSVIGHSMGGYTALAAAGGVPTSFPYESSDGKVHLVNVTPDYRIKSLVLLAPASVWFKDKGALDDINIPILMYVGEKDQITPSFHADIILNGIPDSTTILHKIVKNAGHFSFLSPFPKGMTNTSFPPSQDPPGLNREQFHHDLNEEITEFLFENL
ncbi:alpha/beta fold hydrolase [Bacillus sp. SM2101]|uniref:alpha/beta hydrolase family protein n=1 Tax=Bacillus sp. SM2101 TaxID=2805366 RepID=UPI001BDF5652|nr:alpha/beta fold hydrolase [Bacillus sp. SM2101]